LGRENLRNGKYPKGFSGYFNLWKTNKKWIRKT
jgi:hypothetical protein